MKRDYPLERSSSARRRFAALRRRAPVYAALLIVGLMAAAYIDGGEEPVHPIVQEVAMPQIAVIAE